MAAAAQTALLDGAVSLELQDVDPSAAADYLARTQLDQAPDGWRELTGRLRRTPNSPIAKALSNPLTLALVRDTYRSADDVREFLDFCDAAGPSASAGGNRGLSARPSAARSLCGAPWRDTASVQPSDGRACPEKPRGTDEPGRRTRLAVVAHSRMGVSCPSCASRRVFSQPDAVNTSPLSPLASWRSDRAYWLLSGLVLGLVGGLAGGLGFGFFGYGPLAGLVFGLVLFAIWLVFGLTHAEAWSASIAFAQLARRWHTPVRLMRFLEDARERGVLRTVGPVYQFRHARLQDRLAAQADTATNPERQSVEIAQ
jgi:hypothetical protein